eukprot:60373-Amphidinium_carterae.1
MSRSAFPSRATASKTCSGNLLDTGQRCKTLMLQRISHEPPSLQEGQHKSPDQSKECIWEHIHTFQEIAILSQDSCAMLGKLVGAEYGHLASVT